MTTRSTMPPTSAPAHAPNAPERAEARALLAGAVDAFREGRAAPSAPSPGAAQGQLGEEILAYVYGRLHRSNHASLARAGGIREQALALGRAGRQQEAEGIMKLARFLVSVAVLSPLARVASETFQQAAESYLSYRRGDYADASARMAAALRATDRLADAWGESSFTTGRRVHLLHNQMKVEVRRGALRDAVCLGAKILARTAGTVPGPASAAPALDPVVAHLYGNLVGATLAEALAGVPDAEAKELLGLLDGMEPAGPAGAARVWTWLPLKSAALADDPRAFLAAAAPFLRAGCRRVPVLWYAVALDVVRVARRLGAADDVTEIEAALATDPRVPKALQAAVCLGQDRVETAP